MATHLSKAFQNVKTIPLKISSNLKLEIGGPKTRKSTSHLDDWCLKLTVFSVDVII